MNRDQLNQIMRYPKIEDVLPLAREVLRLQEELVLRDGDVDAWKARAKDALNVVKLLAHTALEGRKSGGKHD